MRTAIACAAALALTGCATPGIEGRAWTPQIDPQGVNQAKYQRDLAECRAYAEANPGADDKAAMRKGALQSGAMAAALVGVTTVATGGLALLPMMAGAAATTAGVAAAGGAAGGKTIADAKHQGIVANCLTGRGYKVLG